jgi:hypothetical protein
VDADHADGCGQTPGLRRRDPVPPTRRLRSWLQSGSMRRSTFGP